MKQLQAYKKCSSNFEKIKLNYMNILKRMKKKDELKRLDAYFSTNGNSNYGFDKLKKDNSQFFIQGTDYVPSMLIRKKRASLPCSFVNGKKSFNIYPVLEKMELQENLIKKHFKIKEIPQKILTDCNLGQKNDRLPNMQRQQKIKSHSDKLQKVQKKQKEQNRKQKQNKLNLQIDLKQLNNNNDIASLKIDKVTTKISRTCEVNNAKSRASLKQSKKLKQIEMLKKNLKSIVSLNEIKQNRTCSRIKLIKKQLQKQKKIGGKIGTKNKQLSADFALTLSLQANGITGWNQQQFFNQQMNHIFQLQQKF